jgi:hypothetical protein
MCPCLLPVRPLRSPADVYCDRRLPADVRAHPVLLGECLGGALYVNDFLVAARQVGARGGLRPWQQRDGAVGLWQTGCGTLQFISVAPRRQTHTFGLQQTGWDAMSGDACWAQA